MIRFNEKVAFINGSHGELNAAVDSVMFAMGIANDAAEARYRELLFTSSRAALWN